MILRLVVPVLLIAVAYSAGVDDACRDRAGADACSPAQMFSRGHVQMRDVKSFGYTVGKSTRQYVSGTWNKLTGLLHQPPRAVPGKQARN